MAVYLVQRRRRVPSLNRQRRTAVVKDFPPDLRLVTSALAAQPDVFDWTGDFPTGKSNLRNIKRIDRLIVRRLEILGIPVDSVYAFLNAVIEAVTNAIQHGRAKTYFSLMTEVRRSPDWFIVTVTVTNCLPPCRRVPLPQPNLRQFTKRGKGTWIMASQLVDRFEVTVQNGHFYSVRLMKLVPRPPA